jgi:D-glycero-D-manno-heptose 1,7-bisphosphate phosphatase
MRAVFLDRDGTINPDTETGYIASISDFQLYPFTATAIRLLNTMGFKTIIVSNQSGIARNLFTTQQLEEVHSFMTAELKKENATIDLILYSPYHPDGIVEPYNVSHISRKPEPGMFFTALHHFPIKASNSFMIGDRDTDIEFGKNNGLTTILVKTGIGEKTWQDRKKLKVLPDFVVQNLLSAVRVIQLLRLGS